MPDIHAHKQGNECGRDREKFAHSRMLIEYGEGSSFGSCSIHCVALDLAQSFDKQPKAIWAADYNKKNLIDAEKAYWVIGGKKPGVMTKTAKWAFAEKKDAEAFIKENGGKLILYQSWNETAVPPRMITEYYKSVQKAMGGPKETADFARLFMVAGSGMCPGFGNAEDFNTLEALQLWVEEDIAPDIIVTNLRDDKGRISRSRLVCAYPKVSRYKGTGDPNEAANFSCITPEK